MKKENFKLGDLRALNFLNLDSIHSNKVLEMRNHPLVSKWMYTQREISKKEHEKFLKNLENANNKAYYLVLDSNEVIGVISLVDISFFHKNAFIGIYVNPLFLHKGMGSKLLLMLKHIAFDNFYLHILYAKVLETNNAAKAFYKKHNFIFNGILVDAIFQNNNYLNIEIFSLRRDS